MKILIGGKGGVGKTTVSALLSKELSRRGFRVLALDADSVPNLAESLGIPPEEASKIVPLSKNEKLVEERTGAIPGSKWGVFFSLTPKVDDLIDLFGIKISEYLTLFVIGGIEQGKEGCMCPAIALAKAFLRHVLLKEKDIVVVDTSAGAEAFGRGLAEKFDLFLCVSEPTLKSLRVAKKLIKMGRDLQVKRTALIVNKAKQPDEAKLLARKVFDENELPIYVLEFDENVVSAENKERGVDFIPEDSPMRRGVAEIARGIEI